MHPYHLTFAFLAWTIAKVVIITFLVMNAILLIPGMKLDNIVHYHHMTVIMEIIIMRHLDNVQIATMQFLIVILAQIVLIAHPVMNHLR